MKQREKYISVKPATHLRWVFAIVLLLGLAPVFAVADSDNSQSLAVSELLARSAQTQPAAPTRQTATENSSSMPSQAQFPNKAPSKLTTVMGSPTNNGISVRDNVIGSSDDSKQSFSNTVHNILPMTPDQVRSLHQMFDKEQQSVAEYPGNPPRPTSTSLMINLAPGTTPPVIRLRRGFITSLVLLDSTGQPWPVAAYDVGDPTSYDVKTVPDDPSSLLIQSLTAYKPGNLVIVLKGQSTPIMLTLMAGQKAVDYRVDLRAPGLGPNASPTLSDIPDTSSPQLLDVLDGVPPVGAKSLQIIGGNAEAWVLGDTVYLRTRMTLLSPSWVSTMSSPDGTHAYTLVKTPVLLASDRGKMIHLQVQGL